MFRPFGAAKKQEERVLGVGFSAFGQRVVVLGCGARDAILDEEFDLLAGEPVPILFLHDLHGAIKHADLAN
jgi:hypothetical protein